MIILICKNDHYEKQIFSNSVELFWDFTDVLPDLQIFVAYGMQFFVDLQPAHLPSQQFIDLYLDQALRSWDHSASSNYSVLVKYNRYF